MKIRMRTNLGTIHAKEIGVDAAECRSGSDVEVSDKAGHWLVARRMADALPEDSPPEIQAVPDEPIRAVPDEPMHPQFSKSNRPHQRSKPFEKQTPDKEE